MASWIHSLLCLIPAPIQRDAVFAPANKYSNTMTKGEHDDEKLLNYTSVFWWGIFKTFLFSRQSNSPIYASLFAFSTSFWALLCVFDKHFTTDQFNSCTLHVFTSHHPSFTENGAGGVCHHLLCSEGKCSTVCVCVCVCAVFMCATMKSVRGDGGFSVEERLQRRFGWMEENFGRRCGSKRQKKTGVYI